MRRCFGPLDAFQRIPQTSSTGCVQCRGRKYCAAEELVEMSKNLAPSECSSSTHAANKAILIQSGVSTGVYIVCSGLVMESRWDQGQQEPVAHLVGPGGIIDPATALQRSPRGAITATTLMDTTLMYVPYHLVDRCLSNHGQLMRTLLGYVCAQLRLFEVRYYLRTACDVYARVVHTLLWIADLIGILTEQKTVLPLRCDRRVLAQLVGSSPETVSRMMSRLRDENLVICREHAIEILDHAKLSQMFINALSPSEEAHRIHPVGFHPSLGSN